MKKVTLAGRFERGNRFDFVTQTNTKKTVTWKGAGILLPTFKYIYINGEPDVLDSKDGNFFMSSLIHEFSMSEGKILLQVGESVFTVDPLCYAKYSNKIMETKVLYKILQVYHNRVDLEEKIRFVILLPNGELDEIYVRKTTPAKPEMYEERKDEIEEIQNIRKYNMQKILKMKTFNKELMNMIQVCEQSLNTGDGILWEFDKDSGFSGFIKKSIKGRVKGSTTVEEIEILEPIEQKHPLEDEWVKFRTDWGKRQLQLNQMVNRGKDIETEIVLYTAPGIILPD